MVELKVYLSEELDRKFRRLAMSIYGFRRGSLSEAAVQALTDWCKEHATETGLESKNKKSERDSDPVARAEERPGVVPSETKENSNGALSTT